MYATLYQHVSEDGVCWVNHKRDLIPYVGPASFLVIVACFAYVSHWYINPQTAASRATIVQLSLAAIGGGTIMFGLYFTYQTLRLNQEGQITDRFSKAIDQLGATNMDGKPRIEVRIGGIYALERIARDSQRDHWQIMEVLSAYVRENAPWPPAEMQPCFSSVIRSIFDRIRRPPDVQPRHGYFGTPKPRADIQAVLAVLRRRSHIELEESQSLAVDLHGTMLIGADLRKIVLRAANLSGANLTDADLREAVLVGANLRHVKLVNAQVSPSDLTGAILFGADLSDANLIQSTMTAVRWDDETVTNDNTLLPEPLKVDLAHRKTL